MAWNDWYSGIRLERFPAPARYLFGISLFGLALGARLALVGILPPEGFPFLTFFPAVLVTALLAGLGPGLLVSALSMLAAWYYFIAPAESFLPISRSDFIALLFFAGILVVDCVVIHLMNAALTKVRVTSDRLRASEAALRDADRQKDVFLATLAHELRNPIAPIRAAAQLIELLRVQDERVRHAAAVVDRQSAQLARLVDDLLDISRIGSGKLALHCKPVEIQTVVEQAVETCQPMVHTAGHRLTVELPADPVVVHADAARMAQCLSNLIHNAVKFTPSGGDIHLTVAKTAENGLSIRVRDNGRGIAVDMLPKLFDVFFQDRSNERNGNSGLGIGLALTHRLVDMHGGSISARSDGVGKGAEFEVLLPSGGETLSNVPMPARYG